MLILWSPTFKLQMMALCRALVCSIPHARPLHIALLHAAKPQSSTIWHSYVHACTPAPCSQLFKLHYAGETLVTHQKDDERDEDAEVAAGTGVAPGTGMALGTRAAARRGAGGGEARRGAESPTNSGDSLSSLSDNRCVRLGGIQQVRAGTPGMIARESSLHMKPWHFTQQLLLHAMQGCCCLSHQDERPFIHIACALAPTHPSHHRTLTNTQNPHHAHIHAPTTSLVNLCTCSNLNTNTQDILKPLGLLVDPKQCPVSPKSERAYGAIVMEFDRLFEQLFQNNEMQAVSAKGWRGAWVHAAQSDS